MLRPLHGHGRRNGRVSRTASAGWSSTSKRIPSASSSSATTWKSPRGTRSKRPAQLLSVPVGDALIGRVVDPVGNPLDGKGPIVTNERRPVETIAPGIAARQPVKQPLQTGIKAIDAMTPIGRGQRELIIGDRKTGKTAIAIDTIINQKGGDVICIYVACGQRASATAAVVEILREHGALDYTIVVSATSSDPARCSTWLPTPARRWPSISCGRGSTRWSFTTTFPSRHRPTASCHLLMRRPPGREAYPGDVFYCHSRLLERACKLSNELGGGSMTALPIIETLEGEVSAYIPTNVISITDGQIYLEPDLFFAGVRPAINVGISVSRVGGNAQTKAMKRVAGSLRLDLAAFRELEAFAQLGTELDKATQRQLDRGYRMVELLKQPQYEPRPVADQVIVIFAGTQGYFDKVRRERCGPRRKGIDHVHEGKEVAIRATRLCRPGTLDDATMAELAKGARRLPQQSSRERARKPSLPS